MRKGDRASIGRILLLKGTGAVAGHGPCLYSLPIFLAHLRAVFLRLLLTLEHLQLFVHRTRQQPVIRLSRLVNIPVYLPIIVPEVW